MCSLIKGFVRDIYVWIHCRVGSILKVAGGSRQKESLKMELDPPKPTDKFCIFRGQNVAVDPYTRSMNFIKPKLIHKRCGEVGMGPRNPC
jgi:hypothetical protein